MYYQLCTTVRVRGCGPMQTSRVTTTVALRPCGEYAKQMGAGHWKTRDVTAVLGFASGRAVEPNAFQGIMVVGVATAGMVAAEHQMGVGNLGRVIGRVEECKTLWCAITTLCAPMHVVI